MTSQNLKVSDYLNNNSNKPFLFPGRRIAGALLLGMMFILLSFSSSMSQEELKDADIARAVELALMVDKQVSSHFIDIAVNEGVVTLSGSVDNLLAKTRAVTISETVKGVVAIVDTIKVNPAPRTDTAIRLDVENALLKDPAADSYELTVTVVDGVVSLFGTVDSHAEKTLSEEVAAQVRGVKEVNTDGIIVSIKSERPDVEIVEDVKRSLERDPYVDSALIDVKVNDGEVTLSGSVGSLAEKNQAYVTAFVSGVTKVNNDNLEVKYWLRSDMERAAPYTAKTDEELESIVKKAFLYDPRVYSFEVNVAVNSGIATLTGVVDNLSAKNAAERDAENTIGVWSVQNFIKVRPVFDIMPLDTDIALDVSNAIERDYLLDVDGITVAVANQKVSLYGNVGSRFEKTHATDVVSRVPGVVDVDNNLVVTAEWDWESDRVIERNIKYEFLWSVFVDGEDIDVSVEDGVATLSGSVSDWGEFEAAVNNSFEGGAKSVQSRLLIEEGNESQFQTYYYPLTHYYTPF